MYASKLIEKMTRHKTINDSSMSSLRWPKNSHYSDIIKLYISFFIIINMQNTNYEKV